MTHEIKIKPQYYVDVITGNKTFELRKADRDYCVGDDVLLEEWDDEGFTGRCYMVRISYVLADCREYGLMDGYCIFGWKNTY